MSDYKNKMGCVSIVGRWLSSVLYFACVIQEPVESSVICLQGFCQKPCSLFESNKTSSHRSRAEPPDCLKAAESKLSKYQFYTLLHSHKVLSREIPCVLPVGPTGHRLWYALIYIMWRPKIHFYCFCDSYHVQDWEHHIIVQRLYQTVSVCLDSFWRNSISHGSLTKSWNSGNVLTHNILPTLLTSFATSFFKPEKSVNVCLQHCSKN